MLGDSSLKKTDCLRTGARMLPDSHRTQHRPVESVHVTMGQRVRSRGESSAGLDHGPGPGSPAKRRGQGVWGRVRRRGRTTGSKLTWWISRRTREGGTSGCGDHSGAGPGGGQLRRDHRLGKRVSWAGGSPARGRGAPSEEPHGPECDGRCGSGDPNSLNILSINGCQLGLGVGLL